MMFSRVIPRTAHMTSRMVMPTRQAGGKTDLEFIREARRHMDDIPVPKRPWAETYNEAQKTLNMKLLIGTGFFLSSMVLGYQKDALCIEPFLFKKEELVLTGDEKLENYDDM